MRYIDEMLRDIPIDELMRGEDSDEDGSDNGLAIIPDVPTIIRQPAEMKESYTQSIRNETKQTAEPIPEQTAEQEAKQTFIDKIAPARKPRKSKPQKIAKANVKSRSMGVLAAALALVIGVGAVTAYFGVVKHTGPLAAIFNGSASDEEKTLADRNAKHVYVEVNRYCAEVIAEGLPVEKLETGMCFIDMGRAVTPGESEFKQTIRSRLADTIDSGEVAFYIDPYVLNVTFAHWRAGDGAYVGQYPDPGDDITFGTFRKRDNTTPDSEEHHQQDPTTMEPRPAANYYAKLTYTTINGMLADRISEAIPFDDLVGRHSYKLSEVVGEDYRKIQRALLDAGADLGSEVFFYVNDEGKILVAQWRLNDVAYVGQYPNPADDVLFAEYEEKKPDTTPSESTETKVLYIRLMKNFWSFDDSTNEIAYIDNGYYEAANNATLVDESELGAELYGQMIEITIEAPNGAAGSVNLTTSDRVGADFRIGKKYYRSDEIHSLLDSLKDRQSYRIQSGDYGGRWGTGYSDLPERWWVDFCAEGLEPVTDLGEEIEQPDMLYIAFEFEGKFIEVTNTKYKNANLQVNGNFYQAKNMYILNYLYALDHGIYLTSDDLKQEHSYVNIGYLKWHADGPDYTETVYDIPLSVTYDDIVSDGKVELEYLNYYNNMRVGIHYQVVLVDEKTGRLMLVTSSDEPEADMILNGKYYKCLAARKLFSEIAKLTGFSYKLYASTECDPEIDPARIEKWYTDFMATKPYDLDNPDKAIDKSIRMASVSYAVGDKVRSISVSGYEYANIYIDGKYYHCNDIEGFIKLVSSVVQNKS